MTGTISPSRPSRRAVLAGGAGLTLAFALSPEAEAQNAPAAPTRLSAYVTIARDGTITIMAPAPRWDRRPTPRCR